MSACSFPSGAVHPRSLAPLACEGIATERYHSKSWDNLHAAACLKPFFYPRKTS